MIPSNPQMAIVKALREQKVPMFAERGNTTAVLQWAHQALPREYHPTVTTAIMMYHNTMLELLAKTIEKEALK